MARPKATPQEVYPETETRVTPENRTAPAENPKAENMGEVLPVKAAEPEPSHLIQTVLRAFSSYPQLYVDTHGSAYTVGTPEKIRQGATLYKNPFYQP